MVVYVFIIPLDFDVNRCIEPHIPYQSQCCVKYVYYFMYGSHVVYIMIHMSYIEICTYCNMLVSSPPSILIQSLQQHFIVELATLPLLVTLCLPCFL